MGQFTLCKTHPPHYGLGMSLAGIPLEIVLMEAIGWLSTALFLISILMPQRLHLHSLGIFTSITTGIYAYHHGATAIWVKWLIAFFFHAYMWLKILRANRSALSPSLDKFRTT